MVRARLALQNQYRRIQIQMWAELLTASFPLIAGLLATPAAGAARAARRSRGTRQGPRSFGGRRTGAPLSRHRRGAKERPSARALALSDGMDEPTSIPRPTAEVERVLPADQPSWSTKSITARIELARVLPFERPSDYFGARGGGIGQALPGALGVELARLRRPVIALSGDGSAMYSVQVLCMAAHHDLAVVFVILNNCEYRILKHNMDAPHQRSGSRAMPPCTSHMDLTPTELSFLDIAQGFGSAAACVTRPGDRPRALPCARIQATPICLTWWSKGR